MSLLAASGKSEETTDITLEKDPEHPKPTTHNPLANESTTDFTIEPRALEQLSLELSTMFEGENDFGLVPGSEDISFGDGVPSSLDELVDWLDIAGPDVVAEKTTTTSPHDIQHFPTFSTDDEWPI